MKLLTRLEASMPNPSPELPGSPEPSEMPAPTSVPDMPSIEMPIDPGNFPNDPGQEPSSMPLIDVM